MDNSKPIMLVEDDKVDAMTVRRALKEINVTNEILIAENGEEALDVLERIGEQLPCIILLDLNMPRMNGLEFLKIVKQNEKFKRVPVIVLTTSGEEKDKMQSFELGIAGYMMKPVDYKQFVEVIKAINLYWTLSELVN